MIQSIEQANDLSSLLIEAVLIVQVSHNIGGTTGNQAKALKMA
jgi:hypothetical protein